MMKLVELYLSSIISCVVVYIFGKNLLPHKNKYKTLKIIVSIITFSIITMLINIINTEVLHGILKILLFYGCYCVFFRINFDISFAKAMTAGLIFYLVFIFSEVIIALLLSLISIIFGYSLSSLKNTVFVSILISGVACTFLMALRPKLQKLIYNGQFNKLGKVLIIALILITLALIGFKIPVSQWKFDANFIVTMSINLSFCIIGIFMLKQQSEINQTLSMYKQVVKHSNTTNRVLEDYRMIGHEHKNQLSIIRQMVHKDNVELIEYIDNLIEKRNDIKYKWVAELNKLPLEGLRGLINYKLIEAEEDGIKISVIISKDVSKVKLNKLSTIEKDHLYSICGVYLDNAIQASSKSKNKEINIEIYKQEKELVFILANTYKGKIELDKLDDYGYSTKGKNHGVGLHIVKTILDEDKLFTQSRKIIDNYFVQKLSINVSKINKKKK